MGLTVIIGGRGSGKTRLLEQIAKQAHAAGRHVASNMDLPFPYKVITREGIDADAGDVIAVDAGRSFGATRQVYERMSSLLLEAQESCDVFIAVQSSRYLHPDIQAKVKRVLETRVDEHGWSVRDGKRLFRLNGSDVGAFDGWADK